MFDFIPQIIILVALVIIVIIIIKNFPKATKYSQEKSGKKNKEETLGARILSVLKYLGKRIGIFSVSIVSGIFSGIKKARKEKIKSKQDNENDEFLGLVKNGSNSDQENISDRKNEEDKVIDLLEKAAEKIGSGNYKEAENNYIEVVKIDPKNIRAYKGLGKIYKKQINRKDAKASYEQVLKIDPNDSEAKEELEELEIK
jgi:tetratricopeptide (TPR) repeat protein